MAHIRPIWHRTVIYRTIAWSENVYLWKTQTVLRFEAFPSRQRPGIIGDDSDFSRRTYEPPIQSHTSKGFNYNTFYCHPDLRQ